MLNGIAWLLKGRHHHPNPKQKEGRGEDCNSIYVLTRHTILNLRNRNYSNEGMYCIFPRKKEKVKKRRMGMWMSGCKTSCLKPEKTFCKKTGCRAYQLFA